MSETRKAVVFDNGFGSIKAGFAGDEVPRVVIPSVDGSHPIDSQGIITNWDDLEVLWKDAYKRLGARPEDNLMVQPLPIPAIEYNKAAALQKTQEKMSQVAFERLQVPELVLRPRPSLSLHASGRETGLVVQAGHGGINIAPIYKGYILPHATLSLALGGKDVNKYLQKRLDQKGIRNVDAQTCQNIKEKLCYVALDFDQEMSSGTQEERFALPDEQLLHVSSERFEGPEVLFQTHLIGEQFAGVHETAYNAVMRSDLDIRLELYSNIILSGGTCNLPGFADRLYKEITSLAPTTAKVSVFTSPVAQHLVWKGGSMLALDADLKKFSVTKAEYDEEGATAFERKARERYGT